MFYKQEVDTDGVQSEAQELDTCEVTEAPEEDDQTGAPLPLDEGSSQQINCREVGNLTHV